MPFSSLAKVHYLTVSNTNRKKMEQMEMKMVATCVRQ